MLLLWVAHRVSPFQTRFSAIETATITAIDTSNRGVTNQVTSSFTGHLCGVRPACSRAGPCDGSLVGAAVRPGGPRGVRGVLLEQHGEMHGQLTRSTSLPVASSQRVTVPSSSTSSAWVDRMAYTLARSQVASDRLVWHPYAGDIGTHVHVGNYTAFLFHGDEIKSFRGCILRSAPNLDSRRPNASFRGEG